MNVKLVGIGSGFVYSSLGPTHQATEDIAIMRVLPEMRIFSPADDLETKKVTIAAAEIKGPVYIRLATGTSPVVYEQDYEFRFGEGVVLREGNDISIIATGGILYDVLQAAKELKDRGISARVINIHTIKPIDKRIILEAASDTGCILTVEEHSIFGGLGSAVSEALLENNDSDSTRFKRLGLDNAFPSGYGSYQEMKEMNGLSKEDIIREARKLYEGKREVLWENS